MIEREDKAFIAFCRWLYDENCYERWHHGQRPYKHFRIYYSKHTDWLKKQYEERQKN